jgi:predicted PurR-regulated permease PerM
MHTDRGRSERASLTGMESDVPEKRVSLRAASARTFVVAATVMVVVGVVTLAWAVVDVLLLVFAGLLFAVLLSAIAGAIARWTGLGRSGALGATVLALVAAMAATAWGLWPSISEQADQLVQVLPAALAELRGWLEGRAWGAWLLENAAPADAVDAGTLVTRATGAVTTTGSALAALLVLVVVGLYVAAQPDLYRRGILRLVPVHGRARADEVLGEVAQVLRWWLLGTMLSMTLVGVLTTVGLWWIGVPLALTFGLLAAALTFIPNIGPAISVVPPLVLALADEPRRAVYVAALYLAIQAVESYAVTPLIQRRTIALPPALTITAQVALGVLVGGIGIAVATPLTAAILTAVRMLVVEDLLERPGSRPARGPDAGEVPA